MFLAPNFFLGGELPEFLESIYKIDTGSHHVAKFRGDRLRELGDYALKKKEHHEHFIRPPVTTVHGRPNEGCNGCATVVQVLQDLFYVLFYL